MFFVWLDDADRNALGCGAGAALKSAQDMGAAVQAKTSDAVTGNIQNADAALHVSNSCREVSTLINIVRENVVSLYERYVSLYEKYLEANDQLEPQATDTLQQCSSPSEDGQFRTQAVAVRAR